MTANQIKQQVHAATMQALRNRVQYTIVGFTEFGIVVWSDSGKCKIK